MNELREKVQQQIQIKKRAELTIKELIESKLKEAVKFYVTEYKKHLRDDIIDTSHPLPYSAFEWEVDKRDSSLIRISWSYYEGCGYTNEGSEKLSLDFIFNEGNAREKFCKELQLKFA